MTTITTDFPAEEVYRRIHDFLGEAGQIARSRQYEISTMKKPDNSPVSDVDYQISKLMQNRFADILALPEHELLDEEGFDLGENGFDFERPLPDYLWVLDPIGGTSAYINGLPMYGIYCGVLYKGMPWIGAVYLPGMHELFIHDGSESCYMRSAYTAAKVSAPVKSQTKEFSEFAMIYGETTDYDGHGRYLMTPHTVGISFCYPLIGRGIGAVTDCKLWDIVGAWPMFAAAGMALRNIETGEPLERLHAEAFTPNLRLRTAHILSTEDNFELLRQRLHRRS